MHYDNGCAAAMDHLKTSQERRDRWYSTISPRHIPVVESTDWNEALQPQHVYSCARAIPLDWLTSADDDTSKLRNVLDKHGFVVISGVLTKQECQEAVFLGWDYLEAASQVESGEQEPPLRRNDATTHLHQNMPKSVEGGMLPYYGSGHSTLAWFVRSHPRIRTIFQAIYGTNHVLSSLDGIVLWLQGTRTDAGWFHLDQHPIHKPDSCGIQGLVNLLPVTKATGGNVLVAHSHNHFPNHYINTTTCFYKERMDEVGTDDWLEVDPTDTQILQPQNVISCLLRPGDVLLWDSRTVHCSNPGIEESEIPKFCKESCGLIRAGVMVSMLPANRISPRVLQQRIEAAHQSRTLTHWVDKVAPLGEERPDQVAMEVSRVNGMRAWQKQTGKPVLLGYSDLTLEQQGLVSGKR